MALLCSLSLYTVLFTFTLLTLQAQFLLYQLTSQSWNTQGFTFNFNGLSPVRLLYHSKHAMTQPCLFRRELDRGILPWYVWRSFGMGGNCPLLQPKWRYVAVTCYNTCKNNNTSLVGLNVGPIQIYVNGVGTLVPAMWNSEYIKQVVAGTCSDSSSLDFSQATKMMTKACTSKFRCWM